MNQMQAAAMRLLSKSRKPDSEEAEEFLQFAVAHQLPERITGAIKDYQVQLREIQEVTNKLSDLKSELTRSWQAFRDQARHTEDLVDQAFEASKGKKAQKAAASTASGDGSKRPAEPAQAPQAEPTSEEEAPMLERKAREEMPNVFSVVYSQNPMALIDTGDLMAGVLYAAQNRQLLEEGHPRWNAIRTRVGAVLRAAVKRPDYPSFIELVPLWARRAFLPPAVDRLLGQDALTVRKEWKELEPADIETMNSWLAANPDHGVAEEVLAAMGTKRKAKKATEASAAEPAPEGLDAIYQRSHEAGRRARGEGQDDTANPYLDEEGRPRSGQERLAQSWQEGWDAGGEGGA